jgi:tRNA 2-selenouridine synthase SelU
MSQSYDLPQVKPAIDLLEETAQELDSMFGKTVSINDEHLAAKIRAAIIIIKTELEIEEDERLTDED